MIELAKRRQSQYAKQIEFCVADATDRKSILELKRRYAKDRLIEIKYNEDISLMLNEQVVKKPSNLVEDFLKEKKICS